MLALERRNLILEKLQEEKRVVVSELSHLFGVSEETIRRDLEKLEQDGYATKSYGGAVLNENVGFDMPLHIRSRRFSLVSLNTVLASDQVDEVRFKALVSLAYGEQLTALFHKRGGELSDRN